MLHKTSCFKTQWLILQSPCPQLFKVTPLPLSKFNLALEQSKFLTEASQTAPPLPPCDSGERSAEFAARARRWNHCRSSLWETRLLLLKFCCFDFSNNLECLSIPSLDKSQVCIQTWNKKPFKQQWKTVHYLHSCKNYWNSWTPVGEWNQLWTQRSNTGLHSNWWICCN